MNNYHLIAELCKLLAESNLGEGEPEIKFDGDKLQFGDMFGRVWNIGAEVWGQGLYKSFDTPAEAALFLYQLTR
jgi:hypothetical protein